MKMMYIFMVGMAGAGVSTILYAGEGPSENPEQVTATRAKSIFSFLNKRSSHARSVAMSSDQKSDSIVGSLDSTLSLQSSSSSSSSSSALSVRSSQSSPSRAGNRLSRAMSRLSMRRAQVLTDHEQDEWVVVEDDVKKKAEILEKELAEKRRTLDDELYKAESIVIPGVIQAARTIFEQDSYASQSVAESNEDPVADIRNTLKHLKNVLNNYLEAKEEYARKVELNFERVGDFCPKGVYMYLGRTVQEGKNNSSDEIKAIIARKKAKATKEETKWMLRQVEYIFDNSESKRLYDAYLADQDNPVAQRDREHYWYLYQTVGFSYAAIEEAAYEYNKALKGCQSLHDKSPDLADQALTLDLIKN